MNKSSIISIICFLILTLLFSGCLEDFRGMSGATGGEMCVFIIIIVGILFVLLLVGLAKAGTNKPVVINSPSQNPPIHYHESEKNESDYEKTAGRLYSRAHDIHYVDKNYDRAYWLYKDIIDDFPDSKESGYAKTQIQNIEKSRDLEEEENNLEENDNKQLEQEITDDKKDEKVKKHRFCHECGEKLEGTSKFCPFCGVKLEEGD